MKMSPSWVESSIKNYWLNFFNIKKKAFTLKYTCCLIEDDIILDDIHAKIHYKNTKNYLCKNQTNSFFLIILLPILWLLINKIVIIFT